MKKLLLTACAFAILATVSIRSQECRRPGRGRRGGAWRRTTCDRSSIRAGAPTTFSARPTTAARRGRDSTCRAITIAIDYTTNTLRDDRRRAQAENPPLGGGFQPLSGELRQIWALERRIRLGHRLGDNGQTVAPAAVERDMRQRRRRPDDADLADAARLHQGGAGRQRRRCRSRPCAASRRPSITVTTPTDGPARGRAERSEPGRADRDLDRQSRFLATSSSRRFFPTTRISAA